MPIAGRNRRLASFARNPSNQRSSCDRPSTKSRILRSVLGFTAIAAFASLAACDEDGNGLTPLSSATGSSSSAARPTINMQLSPASVEAGQKLTLQWNTVDAQSCTASGAWSGPQSTNGSMTVTPGSSASTLVFTLTCSGAGGSVVLTRQVTVSHQHAPTITLAASPATISSQSESTLTWNAVNATECFGSGGWHGALATSGTWSTGRLSNTTEYELTCTGPGGSASQGATVTVSSAAPTVTLNASPSTVSSGSSSTLTWTSENATGCTASGAWTGSKAPSGSQSTGPLTAASAYSITCTGLGGKAMQTATVSIAASAPSVSLSASPSSVNKGARSSLTWTSVHATSCSASGAWSGSRALSGTQSIGPIDANSTYTLTCTGAGGQAAQSTTVSVKSPVPTVNLSVGPSAVSSGGSAMLTWSSFNATSCTASGAWSGSKSTSGSQSTGSVTSNATYNLTCTGPGGNAEQSATLSVKAAAPTVSVSASPSSIASGGTSTVTWSSTNTTACTASGAWSGSKSTSGSQSTGALKSNATYTLNCTGAGGNAVQSATVTVTPVPTVTVNLSSSPSTVASGSASTLTWSATNATSCAASGAWSGSKATSGSQSTGNLAANSTYTLTCSGTGGSGATQSTTVSVTQPTPKVSLSVSPSTITSGNSSTVTWSSSNATACTASGAWSGSKAVSGSQSTGALKANATYLLSCSGAGGSASQSATVSVTTPTPTPTISLSASPSTVSSGGNSTLTWSTTNATACTASGGWTGSQATSGSQSTGALKASTTYTLACTGAGGNASQSATVTVTTPAPTVSLSASPSTVSSGGKSTLTWSTTNATACTASGGWTGSQATSGSKSTGALNATTTFSVTCTGAGGSASQSATVSVTMPVPAVTISANPSTVQSGAAAMLTWSSTNATSCAASGGWSGSMGTSGSKATADLTAATKYTLTCSGAGGTAAQSATVSVAAPQTTATLSAAASNVSSGGSTTLTWSSTNATTCTASGGWSGTLATSGSKSTGAIGSTTTYTITCTGSSGSASQSTTVGVSLSQTSGAGSCSATSGSLALKANAVRLSGVSPLLVFFDATGTSDSSLSGSTTAFQDVSYSWNFGDNNPSGTGSWAYGSNAGHNSKNTATGGVAAHLYLTPGADTAYTVTVTARNGATTASCQLGVTAYDPAGSNGFAGNATTCVSSSGTPVAGSGGCPAGAAVLQSSSISSAVNSSMNGKRTLFKCGDTFSSGATFGGTKFSIGAYGGCEGTQTSRPIFHGSLQVSTGTVTDGRIADIDFENTGSYAVSTTAGNPNGPMTLYNLNSSGNNTSYYWSQGTQWGIIQSTMTSMGGAIGVFVNYAQNNCVNGSRAYNCGGTPSYNNIAYQAVMGNHFNGAGATIQSGGIELLRVSACRMCVIANNTLENANNVGATLKFHSGNSYDTQNQWIGQYTELTEISDNHFLGQSGAQIVEISPQNNQTDERIRNIVFERNLVDGSTDGAKVLVSARNVTIRDNVFYVPSGGQTPTYAVQIAQRGSEWSSPASPCGNGVGVCAGAPPINVEVYNNTCYQTSTCIGFEGVDYIAAGSNSWAQNNLFYSSRGGTTVANGGSGNTVSNNTAGATANPAFTNDSGSFSLISDFTPTANYSGGTSVPVYFDALETLWGTYDLGAVTP